MLNYSTDEAGYRLSGNGNFTSACFMSILGGRKVDLWNLSPDDISLDMIAKSLSLISRAAGHLPFPRIYSVAEHCLDVSARCESFEAKRLGLIHDAAEAFIGDIPGPVKHSCETICVLESRIQNVILDRFGISLIGEREVKYADACLERLEVGSVESQVMFDSGRRPQFERENYQESVFNAFMLEASILGIS